MIYIFVFPLMKFNYNFYRSLKKKTNKESYRKLN